MSYQFLLHTYARMHAYSKYSHLLLILFSSSDFRQKCLYKNIGYPHNLYPFGSTVTSAVSENCQAAEPTG